MGTGQKRDAPLCRHPAGLDECHEFCLSLPKYAAASTTAPLSWFGFCKLLVPICAKLSCRWSWQMKKELLLATSQMKSPGINAYQTFRNDSLNYTNKKTHWNQKSRKGPAQGLAQALRCAMLVLHSSAYTENKGMWVLMLQK